MLDDDPSILRLLSRILNTVGISSRSFTSPEDLFAASPQDHAKIVILDLALDRDDAINVMRELERLRFGGSVLLTSGRDESILQQARRIGLAHHLAMLRPMPKPFVAKDVLDRLGEEPARASGSEADLPSAPVTVDLAVALARGWCTLWYQPKYGLGDDRLAGAEALIRVEHPELGLLLPRDFLPPGGDPVYFDLSKFVLERALSDWRWLAGQGMPIKIAINVPLSVVASEDFGRSLRQHLPRHPEFPGLIVEITEDEAIADPRLIKEVAVQLELYNVGLSIDDVGTAHSGLSRFLDVPFVEAKIDRRFVAGCVDDPAKIALCRSIIDLAHHFGAVACAEGVEGVDDLDTLRRLGCDLAQGYHFGKPAPVEFLIAAQAN